MSRRQTEADVPAQAVKSPVGLPAYPPFEPAYHPHHHHSHSHSQSGRGAHHLGFGDASLLAKPSFRALTQSMSSYEKSPQAPGYDLRSSQAQQQQQQPQQQQRQQQQRQQQQQQHQQQQQQHYPSLQHDHYNSYPAQPYSSSPAPAQPQSQSRHRSVIAEPAQHAAQALSDGQILAQDDPAAFAYTDPPSAASAAAAQKAAAAFVSPPRASLKRKASADAAADQRSPAKRAATSNQPLRPKSDDYSPYGYQAPSAAQYPPYVSNPGADRSYTVYSGSSYDAHDQAGHAASYHPPQASPRGFAYSYAGAPEMAHASAGPSPQQAWAPGPQFAPAGPADGGAATAAALLASPSEVPNPTLIRTSTLQAVDKGGDGAAARGGPPGFNPYSIYPHKAVLDIQGDLAAMARRWDADEWASKRRLVQFWRQQKGSTIHATFRAVPQSDRPSSAVCVSCIWWAERNECFVTSVDCIYLLESLIAVRFTVEEKNRIRRNLEGFRPLTVSKGKKECESFFKLIMQFPSPKPRNIEKDVKVFAWSILPHALKKIIGKYSASYSSTASIIPPTPGASPYPGAPPHEAPHARSSGGGGSADMPPSRAPASPAVTDSMAPNPASTTAPAALIAPATNAPPSALDSPAGRADAHISLPGIVTAAHALPVWPPQTQPSTPHAIAPAAHRGSWDHVSPFLDPTASAPYYREHGPPAEDRSHPSPQSPGNVP